MSKNIVIFSDGTGQEGGRGHSTNVYKHFNMVEDRTPRQIAFYDRGVGTTWRKVTGLVGGRGFARNVRDCYEFIFRHFEAGDRLFLIGFSRGAATVRSLSAFIHLFGILPHARPELIPHAWRIYQTRDDGAREEKARAFIARHHTMWTKVHFLGCYDTVAALGLPFRAGSVLFDALPGFRHRFHNFHLSPSVAHAYHALALDDERQTFHPLLWEPLEASRRRQAERAPDRPMACETLRQVWFAGMHTDVGGGYPEQELSDIPFVWLTDMAVRHGLRIYDGCTIRPAEDPAGTMHDSRGAGWARFYRRLPRAWDRADRPIVHESVLERRTRLREAGAAPYDPWVLGLASGNGETDYEVEPWIPYRQQSWCLERLGTA